MTITEQLDGIIEQIKRLDKTMQEDAKEMLQMLETINQNLETYEKRQQSKKKKVKFWLFNK